MASALIDQNAYQKLLTENEELKKRLENQTEQQESTTFANGGTRYVSPYAQAIADKEAEIANTEFKYDASGDAEYQKLRRQYIMEADRAVSDTLAKASAATGGQANSYAVSAATQASNYYKAQLSTQQQAAFDSAYDRYKTEYSKKLQELSDLQTRETTDYSRWYTQDQTEYNRQQTAYSNLYNLIGSSGYTPTDDELSDAGMSRAAASALRNAYLQAIESGYSGSGGSYSGYSSYLDDATDDVTGVSGDYTRNGTVIDYQTIADEAAAYSIANPDIKADSRTLSNYLTEKGYNQAAKQAFMEQVALNLVYSGTTAYQQALTEQPSSAEKKETAVPDAIKTLSSHAQQLYSTLKNSTLASDSGKSKTIESQWESGSLTTAEANTIASQLGLTVSLTKTIKKENYKSESATINTNKETSKTASTSKATTVTQQSSTIPASIQKLGSKAQDIYRSYAKQATDTKKVNKELQTYVSKGTIKNSEAKAIAEALGFTYGR